MDWKTRAKLKAKQKPKKTRFRNADGSLTAYAFACGYVEVFGDKHQHSTKYVELYKDGCWHVRYYIRGDFRGMKFVWKSFSKLGDARKHYKERIKEIKNNINV